MISAVSRSATSVAQQVEDLRLDRHVERGRRLVGDEQLRLARERHRDHRALAHAAGELVRIVLQPRLRVRDPDLVEQLGSARRGFLLVHAEMRLRAARESGGRSSAPGSGSSSDPGRSSRSACRGGRASARRSSPSAPRPSNRALPAVTRPARGRIPSSASDVTLLPQPDSPTIPSVSPGAMSNETPLTACTVPRLVQKRTSRSSTTRSGSRATTRVPAASGRAPRAARRRSG